MFLICILTRLLFVLALKYLFPRHIDWEYTGFLTLIYALFHALFCAMYLICSWWLVTMEWLKVVIMEDHHMKKLTLWHFLLVQEILVVSKSPITKLTRYFENLILQGYNESVQWCHDYYGNKLCKALYYLMIFFFKKKNLSLVCYIVNISHHYNSTSGSLSVILVISFSFRSLAWLWACGLKLIHNLSLYGFVFVE